MTGGPTFGAEMMARDDGAGTGFGTWLLDACLSMDDPRGEDVITRVGQVTRLEWSSHLHVDQEGEDPKKMDGGHSWEEWLHRKLLESEDLNLYYFK